MVVTDAEIRKANRAGRDLLKTAPRAVAARYDRRRDRVVISLVNGVEFTFPPQIAQGLDKAGPSELAAIEIDPDGLGLHWPKLDADLYVPGLLEGAFGSRNWMAGLMGRAGGRSRSKAKAAAARRNGRKGGRPRRTAGARR
jgi:hypothetical protein